MKTDQVLTTLQSASESKNSFDEFLLAEYNNIAQAHFNTVNSLANFIKHYIAIASVPLAAAAIILNAEGSKATQFFGEYPLTLPLFLTMVSVIGLVVLAYVINIRFDTLLYARTVNGIGKYFYDRSQLTFEDEIKIRALPRTINLPNYVEPLPTVHVHGRLLLYCQTRFPSSE